MFWKPSASQVLMQPNQGGATYIDDLSRFCLAIIQNTVLYKQELQIGWTHN